MPADSGRFGELHKHHQSTWTEYKHAPYSVCNNYIIDLSLVIQLYLLPARRYASTGLCDSDVSVCLSVRHTPVLCLAERKQDREMYTI